MIDDDEYGKRARLARADSLEAGLVGALLRAGYWAVRPRAETRGAPMWSIPRSDGATTRAPDIIVLGHGLIELKESRIDERGRVTLHTEQIRDYILHWPALPLPATLWICASSGDYAGDVGVIAVRHLCELDLDADRAMLSMMDLYRVGSYRGNTFSLLPERVADVLIPPYPPKRETK